MGEASRLCSPVRRTLPPAAHGLVPSRWLRFTRRSPRVVTYAAEIVSWSDASAPPQDIVEHPDGFHESLVEHHAFGSLSHRPAQTGPCGRPEEHAVESSDVASLEDLQPGPLQLDERLFIGGPAENASVVSGVHLGGHGRECEDTHHAEPARYSMSPRQKVYLPRGGCASPMKTTRS